MYQVFYALTIIINITATNTITSDKIEMWNINNLKLKLSKFTWKLIAI